jgi:putative CocE/NonD family hydrolase
VKGFRRGPVAATAIAALTLMITGLGSSAYAARPTSRPAARPTSGQTYDSAVSQEARITTRYGDTMAIELCFPARGGVRALGRFPVVGGLIYTGSAGKSPCASQMAYVDAGFVYAEIQVPGSAGSEGGPWDYADKDWALRNYDAIEWIAKQPWSTGKIGTIGGSGNGVSQLWTSQWHPPHLTTMIPQVSSHNGYDMQYPGGIRSLALVTLLCGIPGTLTTAENGVYAPPTSQQDVEEMVKIQEEKATELRGNPYCPPTYGAFAHPTYDSFWRDLNTAHVENVTIPVWVPGSWDDLFVNASQHDYLTFGSKNKMFSMGYVSHAFLTGGPPGFDPVAQSIRWFDYWLKGQDNGIVDDLKRGRFQYQSWEEWKPKQAADYPIPGTQYTPYYLGSGSDNPLATGSVSTALPSSAGSDAYVYNPASGAAVGGPYSGFARAHNQAVPANRDSVAYLDPGGRGDQRMEQGGRLAYLSQPLMRDTEVTGPITATIYASSTASDTDFVVKLLDVEPDDPTTFDGKHAPPGFWHEVQPGYLKGTYRSYKSGYVKQTPIPVGQVVRYDIEVWPTSWYFHAGHRLGITIASSDGLAAGPNTNPAQVTVYHSKKYPSRITLPIIPKGAARYITDAYMHTRHTAIGQAALPVRVPASSASTAPVISSGAASSARVASSNHRTASSGGATVEGPVRWLGLRLVSAGREIGDSTLGVVALLCLAMLAAAPFHRRDRSSLPDMTTCTDLRSEP